MVYSRGTPFLGFHRKSTVKISTIGEPEWEGKSPPKLQKIFRNDLMMPTFFACGARVCFDYVQCGPAFNSDADDCIFQLSVGASSDASRRPRLGGGAVVWRSGPYLELRIRVCRAAWGIDAIGVDKHRPRSESEKSTWKSTTFFHVPQRRLSQDTGMQHCDRKRLAGRTASHRTARAQTSERLPRNPRPAY